MQKTKIAIAVVALVVGIGIGYIVGGNKVSPQIVGTTAPSHGGSSMNPSASNELSNKKGDAFDQEFIKQMIVHHEGAIEMANLALAKSKREEIVNLSNAIIEAQDREIKEMESWQREWFGL